MLLRETPDGKLAITQTAHAWVSGQMAQAWGNERFGPLEPRDAVCLAAEQHDIGWTLWEPEPVLNAATGYPHAFLELPPETHLGQIWAHAGQLALLTSRYAAMLISMHGTGLYERFRGDREAAGGLAMRFLQEQDAFQALLIESLSADPASAPYVANEVIARNRRLIAIWDRLSLNICWGMREPLTIGHVPLANGLGPLTFAPVASQSDTLTVAPWPFAEPRVRLIFEGRLLTRPFSSQEDLQRGLAEAPWRSVVTTLIPG